MRYINCKDMPSRGVVPKKSKSRNEYVISSEEWQLILETVENSAPTNPQWKRDYAIIFLGGALGMRRGEIPLFERNHFRFLEDSDVVYAPTLKQEDRIPYACSCGRRCRVKSSSGGCDHLCARCGKSGRVPMPGKSVIIGAIEKDIPIVEENTKNFILDYLKEDMRPDQRWLFEGRNGYHMSGGHVNRIFNTYCIQAGLSKKISFHTLRHLRGVRVYSLFKDMTVTKDALRHKDVKTTQVYAGLDEETRLEYKEKLEKKSFDPLKKRKKKS